MAFFNEMGTRVNQGRKMSGQASFLQGLKRGIENRDSGSPTWGLSCAQFKSIIRLLALFAGLGMLLLTVQFHVEFFGDWAGIPWGGLVLGVGVTAAQLALLHRGWRDPVLLVGGIASYLYDIVAVTTGLMAAAHDRSPVLGDWLFVLAGALISTMAEALIEYGLLKAFWTEGDGNDKG